MSRTSNEIGHLRRGMGCQRVVRGPRSRCDNRSHLGRRGVETLVHYPIPPFRQRAYENEFDPAHYPISDLLHSEVLSLPIGPHMSEVDVARVIDAVVSYEP